MVGVRPEAFGCPPPAPFLPLALERVSSRLCHGASGRDREPGPGRQRGASLEAISGVVLSGPLSSRRPSQVGRGRAPAGVWGRRSEG